MTNYYWNDWYAGWGWFLWYAVFVLIFFSIGNWGYTYRAHRKFGGDVRSAMDILNERYAAGEIEHEEYLKMKAHIQSDRSDLDELHTPVRKEVPGSPEIRV